MRHRVFGKKFSRDIRQRKSLFKNLIKSLVLHEEIQTTETKAKAIKGVVDKLIANGKKGTLHVRRIIAAFLQDKRVVNKVIDELGPRFKDRVSGFTRIIRLGERRGDNAVMVRMELVEKKQKEEQEKKKEEGGEAKPGLPTRKQETPREEKKHNKKQKGPKESQ